MEIKLVISNNYSYKLAAYPYNEGALPTPANAIEIPPNATAPTTLEVAMEQDLIIDIPGISSVAVQNLGEDKLADCHERHCEHPQPFDQLSNMALIRCHTTELYWRFNADETAVMHLSVNRLGSVCIDKVESGEVRLVNIPELYIAPAPDAAQVCL